MALFKSNQHLEEDEYEPEEEEVPESVWELPETDGDDPEGTRK